MNDFLHWKATLLSFNFFRYYLAIMFQTFLGLFINGKLNFSNDYFLLKLKLLQLLILFLIFTDLLKIYFISLTQNFFIFKVHYFTMKDFFLFQSKFQKFITLFFFFLNYSK